MTIFKRFPVAVLICAAVIALCCWWGYSRVYVPPEEMEEETVSSSEHHRAGESNLNYYLGWMKDEAGFFTPETADTIARRNLSLDTTYNSLVAIHTVNYLNGKDIETFAKDAAEDIELGGRDMLLLLDKDSQNWYVVYGPGLEPYVEMNTELKELFNAQLSPDFFAVTSNRRVILLFDALQEWFEANVPPADEKAEGGDAAVQPATFHDIFFGILFTLLTNIWWILILVVALTLLDRTRCRNYVMAHPDGHDPAHPFHPLLFWHHPGSNWFANMEDLADDDRYDPEEDFEDEASEEPAPGEQEAEDTPKTP